MAPSKKAIQVATNELRTEAGVWDEQSEEIRTIVTAAESLRLGRLEAGMFQLIVSPYDSVVDQVTERCREGAEEMAEIADTLHAVAKTYDEEESSNEHALRDLY